MFDDKTVEAYRGIKAPESLREKVMASCDTARETVPVRAKKRRRVYAAWSAVAACFAAVVALWSFWGWGGFGEGAENGVSVSLAETKNDAFGISLAREMNAEKVVVSVCCDETALVAVNRGEISLEEVEASEPVSSLEIQGDTELVWEFLPGEGEPLILTVEANGKEHAFRLEQNAESGEWNICPEE